MSTDRGLNKEDVVHTYNGILYAPKWDIPVNKEITYINMEELRDYHAKSKTNTIRYHSYVECNFFLKIQMNLFTETDLQTLKTNLWSPKGNYSGQG